MQHTDPSTEIDSPKQLQHFPFIKFLFYYIYYPHYIMAALRFLISQDNAFLAKQFKTTK